jgi:hypothetical protein
MRSPSQASEAVGPSWHSSYSRYCHPGQGINHVSLTVRQIFFVFDSSSSLMMYYAGRLIPFRPRAPKTEPPGICSLCAYLRQYRSPAELHRLYGSNSKYVVQYRFRTRLIQINWGDGGVDPRQRRGHRAICGDRTRLVKTVSWTLSVMEEPELTSPMV